MARLDARSIPEELLLSGFSGSYCMPIPLKKIQYFTRSRSAKKASVLQTTTNLPKSLKHARAKVIAEAFERLEEHYPYLPDFCRNQCPGTDNHH